MDLPATIGLSLAGVSTLAAIGAGVYALVLSRRLAPMERDRNAAIDARIAALAELVSAAEEIKGLRAQLLDARLQNGQLYERLANLGAPGAGALVDDHVRRLYPDADDHAAGASDAGPLSDRSPTAAAEAEADLLSGERPRARTRDLLQQD